MPIKLKVQIVEDNAADAELVLHELRRAGFDPEWKRIETEPDYLAQIDQGWEIILADYNLPEFSGLRALQLLRGRDPDLPFIIVSGTIGEDMAASAIKAGANDYVLKSQLARLGPVIQRELRDAADRRERRRMQEELRKSEERYRTVSRLSLDFAYSCFHDGEGGYKVDWITDAFYTLTGYSDAELRGKGCWLFVSHPDDYETATRPLRELKAGESDTREFRIVTKDGRVLCIANHMECQADPEAPGGLRLIGGVRDITKSKQAEEELGKSEERFRLLFEYAPDAYYLSDLKGNFIDGNKAAEKTTGYPKKELIGSSFLKLNLLPLGQYPKAAKLLLDNALGKSTGPDEFTLRRKSGEMVRVEISTYPLKLDDKSVVLGIARDITERARTEDALRKAEENFRRSLDDSPLGIRIIGPHGETLYANRAVLDLFDYADFEELVSTPINKLYTPESYAKFQSRREERLKGEDSPSEYEISIIRKTGEIRHLQVSRKETLWDGQKRFQAIYRDITEDKRAEAELQASETRHRLLIEKAQFPIVVSSLNSRILFINEHASRLFEVPAPQAVGLRVSAFWWRKADLRGFIHLLKERGEIKDFEAELRTKSGTKMTVLLSSNLIEYAGRQANITVFQDITDRKRAELELLEAHALVETVVEHIPLMIFLKEATDLKFVIFNRAGEELLGYDRTSLLGKNNLDLFPPEQAAHFMAKDREALAGRGVVDIPEEFIQTAKKGTRLLHTRKVSIKGEDGTTKYLLGISEDITESKKAEDTLQETLRGLRKALGSIIQVLASVSEIRDPYTAGHQRRVADLAQAIARQMGLAPGLTEGIRVAGLIHDIGKMSIPAEILSKPAVLSKIEYALIQSHAQVGHDILSKIEFPWPIAEMILQHHERRNGSGYPQGLNGDDIMLESRILAVADVIEAMASHRPYRPSLGIEAALKEIENDGGVLFDPAVVSACLTLFREKGYKLKD